MHWMFLVPFTYELNFDRMHFQIGLMIDDDCKTLAAIGSTIELAIWQPTTEGSCIYAVIYWVLNSDTRHFNMLHQKRFVFVQRCRVNMKGVLSLKIKCYGAYEYRQQGNVTYCRRKHNGHFVDRCFCRWSFCWLDFYSSLIRCISQLLPFRFMSRL